MRFSIRSLIFFTTVIAIVAWWLASPSANASRFVRAINEQEYNVAAKMFVLDGPDAILTDWNPHGAVALVAEVTLRDLLRGRREVRLSVTYRGDSKNIVGNFPLEASCRGMHVFDKPPYKSSDLKFR